MNWKDLQTLSQLEEIITISKNQPVLIFKHSTRCSISDIALRRMKSVDDPDGENILIYYLDLIQQRDLSQAISAQFHVYHESPQLLIIKDGECTYDCSHLDIAWNLIKEEIAVEVG